MLPPTVPRWRGRRGWSRTPHLSAAIQSPSDTNPRASAVSVGLTVYSTQSGYFTISVSRLQNPFGHLPLHGAGVVAASPFPARYTYFIIPYTTTDFLCHKPLRPLQATLPLLPLCRHRYCRILSPW